MPRPISRAELARLAGVSRMAITKACRGPLAGAVIGRRVDLDHESVRAYLKGRGIDLPPDRAPTKKGRSKGQTAKKAPPRRPRSDDDHAPPKRTSAKVRGARVAPRSSATAPKEEAAPPRPRGPSDATEEDIERYAHLPLSDLQELFGTATAFNDWLAALKLIEEVREKNLKNDATEGRLIERELVATHVFGAIEASHRRLLGDSSKTIARRVYGLAKSGAGVEEAETLVRELISAQLRRVKDTAARVVRNA